MIQESEFHNRVSQLRQELQDVCERCGRNPADVEILPVTKTHPPQVFSWVSRAGFSSVGENRVQEAELKKKETTGLDLRWELIGHLQTNKVKSALALFDRIQSVDSIRLATQINKICALENRLLPVLIQFNAGEDPAKYGFPSSAGTEIWKELSELSHLKPEGLMTLAPFVDCPATWRRCFQKLRSIRDEAEDFWGKSLPVLSMGMSADWKIAVDEGSTQIRPGSLLFGPRQASS